MELRARAEEGFGLVELLIALVILNIGVLAVVAAFTSGSVALRRAAETQVAASLADEQMELYRAVRYVDLYVDTASVTTASANSTYAADSAYSGSQVTATCSPVTDVCNPMRTTTGPDNRSYRIDTYIVSVTPTSGRAVKQITVVVRRSSPTQTLARLTSVFDQSTG